MSQNRNFFITAIVVFLIIISILIIIANLPEENRYSFIEEGVEFISYDRNPGEYIMQLSTENSFIVSPMFEESSLVNAHMTDSLTMFSAVLTAQRREVIAVGRLYDSSGNMQKCQTNDGDYRVNREITIEECNSILSSPDKVKFLISFPDSSLERAQVIVEENKVTIKPRTYDDTARIPFLILKTMFADSEQTINEINSVLAGISGGNS